MVLKSRVPRDAIECDESRWPVVVYRTVGIPSEHQVDAFIRHADMMLARREPYAVVFDNTQSGRVPPYLRKAAASWLETNQATLSKHCHGTALVFRSAALRFVMSTVMLVVSHPVGHEVFGDVDSAVRWCDDQVRRAQLSA